MYRSNCLLRIGDGKVHGLWQSARWAGGGTLEASAEFNAEPAEETGLIEGAIDAVLRQVLPKRRLSSPFVRVSLAGCYVMAAILAFSKLPARVADRRLLITQRFCREHSCEARTVAVAGFPLRAFNKENANMLCLAVEQRILDEINGALARYGIHADVIAPSYLLSFEEASKGELESPGVAALAQDGALAILVWDEQGTLMHIASVRWPGKDDSDAQRRISARIRRYAQIVAKQSAPPAIYVDGAAAIMEDLARGGRELKLFAWPGALLKRGQSTAAVAL